MPIQDKLHTSETNVAIFLDYFFSFEKNVPSRYTIVINNLKAYLKIFKALDKFSLSRLLFCKSFSVS